MSYQPKLIPLDELVLTASNMAEDATFAAGKAEAKKSASPTEKRRKKYMADYWYSVHQYLLRKKES